MKVERLPKGADKDSLALWVADMDFACAEPILKALHERIDRKIFGYTMYDADECMDAVTGWMKKRYGWEESRENLFFCPGVVAAYAALINLLTEPGDGIVLQRPIYYPFTDKANSNGRIPVDNALIYENGAYRIDFEDLDKKMADPANKVLVVCSPHNPTGRVWTEDELKKTVEICKKYDKWIICDEIHCDLTDPGFDYVPFASVGEHCAMNSVTCMAPTKTFNIAGLNSAAVMIPNPVLRHKVWRALNTDEVAEPNAFAMDATLAAFNEGEPWLNELRAYLAGNKATARAMFDKYNASVPADRRIIMVEGHATYLLWVDCSAITHDTDALCDYLKREHKVMFSAGSEYGGNGHDFVRINVACPRARMIEGLARFIDGLLAYRAQSFPKMD